MYIEWMIILSLQITKSHYYLHGDYSYVMCYHNVGNLGSFVYITVYNIIHRYIRRQLLLDRYELLIFPLTIC